MRRIIALAGAAALVMALTQPAMADSGTATLSVTVNNVATIVFSDAEEDFGPINPGDADVEVLAALTYEVSTNNSAGFLVTVEAAAMTPSAGPWFELRRNGASLPNPYVIVSGGGCSGAGCPADFQTWRSTASAGLQSYSDDVRTTATSSQTAGSFSQVLTYTASTN